MGGRVPKSDRQIAREFGSRWVDDDAVWAALRTGDLAALEAAGVLYCMSSSGQHCIVLRQHAAWHLEGQGWRDGNYPADEDAKGRLVVNFFFQPIQGEPGGWFKAFVPASVHPVRLSRTAAGCCTLESVDGIARTISFDRFEEVRWDLMTGNAQEEGDILSRFNEIWDR